MALPPPNVANFLAEMFFEHAQTNYSYIDPQRLHQMLENFYQHPRQLVSHDAAWLCTVLMVLAIGCQFAHLSSQRSHDYSLRPKRFDVENLSSPDDDAALTFYHAATTLTPDAISLASMDSVQAFLLLGVYTLPIDPGGLSYTYLGVATKIAIQNGMHRRYHKGLDARTIEFRNRIWWSAYTLEK